MGDNLKIGATVDKAGVEEGFTSVQDLTQKVTQRLSISFEECSARTKRAMRSLGDDVKQAADTVSAQSIKVAEATRLQGAALADVRSANVLVRDSSFDAATATALLAAAQDGARQAARNLAEAQGEVAAATRHTVPEMAAASASIRVFEGAMPIRAVERFLSTTLGLGPVMAAAFPVVGAIALAEVLGHTAMEAYKLYQNIVLLKQANTDLDQIDLKVAENVKKLGEEAARSNIHFIEMTQGVAAARRAADSYEAGKQIDLSGVFNDAKFRELPDRVKAGMEATFKSINPAELDSKIAEVRRKMDELQDVISNPEKHRTIIGAGRSGPIYALPDLALAKTQMRALKDIDDELVANAAARDAKIRDLKATSQRDQVRENEEARRKAEEATRAAAAMVRAAAESALRADEDQLNELKLNHEVSVGEEVRFWQAKLAAARSGSAEYKLIAGKLAPLEQRSEQQEDKKKPIETETDNAGLKEAEREWMEANEAKLKSDQQTAKEGAAAFRSARDEEIRLADEGYRDAEKNSQAQVQLGKLTASQRLADLKAASDQEYQVKMRAISMMELLDMGNAAAYQADLNKELQATREHTRQITELNNQAALKVHQQWQKVFTDMNADIISVANSWMQGSRNMTMVFAKMFDTILTQLADFALKWLLKQAEMWAENKILTALGLVAQRTQQGVSNVAAVTGDAAVAAAGTMAYYSAINPVLAPAAAAAAFSVTMAYAPMAAMALGGVVNGQKGMAVPILAHAGERVLTPQQTQTFEKLANGTGAAAPGRGDTHNHNFHYNGQVNAYDKSGMRSTLKAHAEDIVDIVRDAYRNGSLA